MKYLNKILATVILLSVFACSDNQELGMADMSEYANDYKMDEMPMAEENVKYANANSKTVEDDVENPQERLFQGRKLIKTGSVSFQVEDLTDTKTKIKKAVKKYKAYISSEDEDSYSDKISVNISIRVPFKDFDNLLADISKGVESFDSKNISVSDVTEEFVDITARIKTKKELENRYHELLEKANTVGEILEIEREIADLRSDIESFEGRLKYLKSQVSFSTLSISFYKSTPTNNKFNNKFSDGFGNGWDNFIWFFVFLSNLWPFILIVFTIVFFVVRRERRKRKNLI